MNELVTFLTISQQMGVGWDSWEWGIHFDRCGVIRTYSVVSSIECSPMCSEPVQIFTKSIYLWYQQVRCLGENTSDYKPARQLRIQIQTLHVCVGLPDSIIQKMFELIQRNNETSLLLEHWGCLDDTYAQLVLQGK